MSGTSRKIPAKWEWSNDGRWLLKSSAVEKHTQRLNPSRILSRKRHFMDYTQADLSGYTEKFISPLLSVTITKTGLVVKFRAARLMPDMVLCLFSFNARSDRLCCHRSESCLSGHQPRIQTRILSCARAPDAGLCLLFISSTQRSWPECELRQAAHTFFLKSFQERKRAQIPSIPVSTDFRAEKNCR